MRNARTPKTENQYANITYCGHPAIIASTNKNLFCGRTFANIKYWKNGQKFAADQVLLSSDCIKFI